ncbi:MAG: PAS domain S-box protein [Elusimicrobia bacterium]|nr:PAS domain S-box protein [Elusimicrobiota bacterium]
MTQETLTLQQPADQDWDKLRAEKSFPVVLADDRGRVTYVNRPFELTFGWSGAELQGQPLVLIVPEDFRAMFRVAYSRLLSDELLSRTFRFKVRAKDGRELDCENRILSQRLGGRRMVGAILRPLRGNERV